MGKCTTTLQEGGKCTTPYSSFLLFLKRQEKKESEDLERKGKGEKIEGREKYSERARKDEKREKET